MLTRSTTEKGDCQAHHSDCGHLGLENNTWNDTSYLCPTKVLKNTFLFIILYLR